MDTFSRGAADGARLNFNEVSEALRQNRRDWLPRVFPQGKVRAGIFYLGNADGGPGESLPVPLDGSKADALTDFAGNDFRGDDLDLFARGTRQALPEAARDAASRFGLDHGTTKPSNGAKPKNTPKPKELEPFPDGRSIPAHPQLGAADAFWLYRRPTDGRPILAHLRFDERDTDGNLVRDDRGKIRKQFRPVIWRGDRFRWEWPDLRPLYGLSELMSRPDAPVLVPEGEKATDAARKLLPDFVVLTWPQGTSGAAQADWSPLKGRNVTILPDADEPGAKAASIVAGLIRKAGATAVRIVALPKGLPVGWDVADTLPDGWTADTLQALMQDAPEPNAKPEPKTQDEDTFPALSLADCLARQADPVRWLIDGVLPERGLACVFGRSNSFKSFAAIDQACHIAHGRPYHGRDVRQAPAMYLALEGSAGVIRQRIPGWHRHYGLLNTTPQLAVIETPVTLTKTADSEKLKRTALKLLGRLPGIIVVDVLKRTMDGSESDDEVVARFIHSLQSIFLTDKDPCLILVITHSGFSDDSRARGHSDLWGSYDTRLACEGSKEDLTSCLTVERHKDAESGGTIAFKMKQVETGMLRDDLSPVTTLVPIADGAVAHQPKNATPKGPKLSAASQVALTVLQNTLADHGEKRAGQRDIPNGVPVVPVERWRQGCYTKGLADSSGDDPGKKAEAERKAFNRVRKDLEAKRFIATDSASTVVWIVQPQVIKTGQAGHVPGQPDLSRCPGTSGTDGTHSFRSVPVVPLSVPGQADPTDKNLQEEPGWEMEL